MSAIKYQFREVEQIKTTIWPDARKGSIHIAQVIAQAIKEKAAKGENILLGLSTGNSPVQVYKELVRMHKEDGLSFKNVISFNLDEYYPMQPDASQSYVAFMKYHLFDHIDIKTIFGKYSKDFSVDNNCVSYFFDLHLKDCSPDNSIAGNENNYLLNEESVNNSNKPGKLINNP